MKSSEIGRNVVIALEMVRSNFSLNESNMKRWLSSILLLACLVLLVWQFGFQDTDADVLVTHPTNNVQHAPLKSTESPSMSHVMCNKTPPDWNGKDFSSVETILDCILHEYGNATRTLDGQQILSLDAELEHLSVQTKSVKDHDAWGAFWEEKNNNAIYKLIGIEIDREGMRYNKHLQKHVQVFPEFGNYKRRLEEIRIAYLAIPKTQEKQNIEKLYELDDQIKETVVEIRGKFDTFTPFPDFPEIGVYGTLFAGALGYNGKIRYEADTLIPQGGFIDPSTGKKIEIKGEGYSKLKNKLESIYQKYMALKKDKGDAEKLYELSEELTIIPSEINSIYTDGGGWRNLWEEKYSELGLFRGHYSEAMEYSGKLAVDSYELNPHSRYREMTMYAALFDDQGAINKSLAQEYLKDFPNGKKTASVYFGLGAYYQTNFNLYLEEKNKKPDEESSEEFCSGVDSAHNEQEAELSRKMAMEYYKKSIALGNTDLSHDLDYLEKKKDNGLRAGCSD